MKAYPKIKGVQPQDGKRLLVTFDNGTRKIYDCKPLLTTKIFEVLQEDGFFNSVQADPGGYGVSWSEEMDLSESELWEHGQLVDPEDAADSESL